MHLRNELGSTTAHERFCMRVHHRASGAVADDVAGRRGLNISAVRHVVCWKGLLRYELCPSEFFDEFECCGGKIGKSVVVRLLARSALKEQDSSYIECWKCYLRMNGIVRMVQCVVRMATIGECFSLFLEEEVNGFAHDTAMPEQDIHLYRHQTESHATVESTLHNARTISNDFRRPVGMKNMSRNVVTKSFDKRECLRQDACCLSAVFSCRRLLQVVALD